ncbi:MAG: hypothetical protein ABEJ80_06090 [Halarchaeum sp.]
MSDTAGVRGRLGRLFSLRHFALALLAALVGLFAGGLVPLVGALTRFLGLFVVAFALGALGGRRAYLEIALAAALASLVSVLGGLLTSAVLPIALDYLARNGLVFAGAVAAFGLLVGVAGYYFGRDLRAGFTRSL